MYLLDNWLNSPWNFQIQVCLRGATERHSWIHRWGCCFQWFCWWLKVSLSCALIVLWSFTSLCWWKLLANGNFKLFEASFVYRNSLNPSVEIKFCIILCWIGFLVPLHHLLFLDILTFVPSNCTALHKFPGSAPLSISSWLAFTDYSWKDVEICNLHLVSMDFVSFQVKYIRCKGRDWAQ